MMWQHWRSRLIGFLPSAKEQLSQKNLRKNVWIGISSALVVAIIVAIKAQLITNDPDGEFRDKKVSIEPSTQGVSLLNSQSILLDIHRTKELHICILPRVAENMTAQVPPPVAALRPEDVRRLVEPLVRQWLSFLRFNRTWFAENVQIHFYLNDECAKKPKEAITIMADVGPIREPKRGEKCETRKVGDLEGRFFAAPDNRVCMASYNGTTRTALISAGGGQGEYFALAHVLGHAFGIGDAYDYKHYLDGLAESYGATVMAGGHERFFEDDALAMNAVWTALTAGAPCPQAEVQTAAARELFAAAHCGTPHVAKPIAQPDGTQTCPQTKKYWLTPLNLCVEIGGEVPPECPTGFSDFDPKSGLCCPAGEGYDPGKMACARKDAMTRKYRPSVK
jgi:hypothetical protein